MNILQQKNKTRMRISGVLREGWSLNYGDIGVPCKLRKGKTGVVWNHCREVFGRKWTRRHNNKSWGYKLIFFRATFCHRIIEFLDEVEKRLNLKKKSAYGATSVAGVVWIRVSDWWAATPIRRQFFTLCLRAAQRYEGDFGKALAAYGLSGGTMPAVTRFFNGYTKLKGNLPTMKGRHGGWYATMRPWIIGKGRAKRYETKTEWEKRIQEILVK